MSDQQPATKPSTPTAAEAIHYVHGFADRAACGLDVRHRPIAWWKNHVGNAGWLAFDDDACLGCLEWLAKNKPAQYPGAAEKGIRS